MLSDYLVKKSCTIHDLFAISIYLKSAFEYILVKIVVIRIYLQRQLAGVFYDIEARRRNKMYNCEYKYRLFEKIMNFDCDIQQQNNNKK